MEGGHAAFETRLCIWAMLCFVFWGDRALRSSQHLLRACSDNRSRLWCILHKARLRLLRVFRCYNLLISL